MLPHSLKVPTGPIRPKAKLHNPGLSPTPRSLATRLQVPHKVLIKDSSPHLRSLRLRRSIAVYKVLPTVKNLLTVPLLNQTMSTRTPAASPIAPRRKDVADINQATADDIQAVADDSQAVDEASPTPRITSLGPRPPLGGTPTPARPLLVLPCRNPTLRRASPNVRTTSPGLITQKDSPSRISSVCLGPLTHASY